LILFLNFVKFSFTELHGEDTEIHREKIYIYSMKRILLFFIFFFPLFSSAQNDWAPVGAKWNYTGISMEGPELYNREIESVFDTIINGTSCRKLTGDFGCSPMSNDDAYVYSEGRKYFYYNSVADTFFLLYDLNLNPNQSWTIYLNNFDLSGLDSLIISIIDTSSLLVNGYTLKTQTIDQVSYYYYFIGNEIVEKAGSTFFLFPQHGACDPPTGPLRCYEDSIIGLYETGEAPYCNYSNVGINENQISQLEIYPTPPQDFLYLKTPTRELDYKILDNTGRTILSGKTEKEINVQTLSPGYYRIVFPGFVNRAFIKL